MAPKRSLSFVQIRVKNAKFFDRDVIYGIDLAHHNAMRKFGAYIRRDAQRSMRTARKRKTKKNTKLVVVGPPGQKRAKRVSSKPSAPGTPPRSVIGHIKRFLWFEYSPEIKNLVVGPIFLPPAKNKVSKFTVPAMHEQMEKVHAYATRILKNKIVHSTYPQRPFMRPAFDRQRKKLPQLYKDSVRRR
jgi:hypothetical protein